MKNNLGEKNLIKITNNLSKNDIIKRFSNIKQAKTKFNNNLIIKRNKDRINLFSPKKNLTCSNFYNNFSNIFDNNYKISNKKLKKDLFLDSEYSSFINKNSKFLNSDFPLTGMNSQNFINTEIEYKKIFSAKSNKLNFSENRTKSSTTKNTKSNILNTDSSFKRNEIFLLSPKISKENIHYSKKSYNYLLKTSFSKYRRENIFSFMEKTRKIRKEKIIKLDLEQKYQSKSEIEKDKLELLNNTQEQLNQNLSLINTFYKSFNDYVKNLELDKLKQTHLCDELYKNYINLDINNNKMKYQIGKLKREKEKYNKIEDFFLLVKYGSEYLDNKDENKDYKLILKNSLENKRKKKLILSESANQSKILSDNKEKKQKKKYNKYYSINKYKNNSKINSGNKYKEKTPNKLLKKSNTFNNNDKRRDSSSFDNIFEINHILTNLENILLNDLNHLNEQKNQINILKNDLSQIDINSNNEINNLINSKSEMLNFLKKENNKLKYKLELMRKTKYKMENFRNVLNKKLLKILIGINKEINFQEKLKLKDLFYILKIESSEFLNKNHISKTLYMIKIIELITLFLKDLMNNYLKCKKSEELFKKYCIQFEKEKVIQIRRLIREQVKHNKELKKMLILEKANKIRFHSKRKIDIKPNRFIHNTSRKKITKRNNSHDNLGEWISYD